MTDKQALEAIIRKEKGQPTIKRLWAEDLIEVTEVTHMNSNGREFLPTFITPKGKRLLDS